MKEYSYHGVNRLLNLYLQLLGIIGIILFSSIGILLWSGMFVQENKIYLNPLDDPRYTFLCFGLTFVIGAWSLGSILLNAFPTIYLNDNGIKVTAFLFLRIFIPWGDIIDINTGHPPKGCILVRVRKITIFHRLIGWIYSYTLFPSFLIGSGIKDRDELINIIKHKT